MNKYAIKIQNMKQVIVNKNFHFLSTGSYYAIIDDKLTSVKIVAYIVNLQEGKCYHEVTLPDGATRRLESESQETCFYESENDFKTGNRKAANLHLAVLELIKNAGLCCYIRTNEDGVAECAPFCWVMQNGEPAKYDVVLNELRADKFPQHFDIVISEDKSLFDVPKRFWTSREEVLLWNDYTVEEEDGTCRVVRAPLPRLTLTDEQKSLVQAIRDAFNKAREAGVKFVWQSDREKLTVFNANNVENLKNSERGECKGFVLSDDSLHCDEFSIGFDIYDFWQNYDLNVDVEFKADTSEKH